MRYTHQYLSSTKEIAKLLKCRPAYLTKAAAKQGYSFSRAVRWIRFLHAIALLAGGCRVETMLWRLGFSDAAGWHRFCTRLVGRSPGRLPGLPMELWVRKAVDDVYFGLSASGPLRKGLKRQ